MTSDGSYIVTPFKDGYAFSPASFIYDGLTSDQLGQNFSGTAIFVNVTGGCVPDRDAVHIALTGYHEANREWPTIDGFPGDIRWDRLVPDYLDGIPKTNTKCDWWVSGEPEGSVCIAHYC